MENQRMSTEEVTAMTGLDARTLYRMMDSGQADLGAVVHSKDRNTYVFFRPKVEAFVNGTATGCAESTLRMTNHLLTLLLREQGVKAEEIMKALP